jgi:hypothetical protein
VAGERLKPLRGKAREYEFLGLDTEDDQLGFGPGRGFYLGVVHTPEGPRTFTSKRRLIDFLMRPRWGGWWIACHNLEYDVQNIFGPKEVVNMNPCFSGSKLCGLRVQVGPTTAPRDQLTFFDTSCYLAEPLAKLAKLVNSEKLDMHHKAGDRRVTAKRTEYCQRDAELVWKIANFIQDGLLKLGGQLKFTAAAAAMDLYRRKYQPVSFPVLDDSTRHRFFEGYCGGRVECFRLGDFHGRLYGNDFNGMYASVMQDLNLPDLDTLHQGRDLCLDREGMACVDLEIPDHLWAGPLPHKTGEKLIFPIGRLTGCWPFNELRQALNYGCRIQKVRWAITAAKSSPFLREYAGSLRAIREDPKTEPAVSRLAKLMSNSLYGKWAQRAEDFQYMSRAEFFRQVDQGTIGIYIPERTQEFPLFDLVRVVRNSSFPNHSNVIWAAAITAGARCKLYPHLDEATTLYCDTDSVLGFRGYPKTKTLGQLAHKDNYKRLVIRGNKLYAGETTDGWESHAKGVPRAQALDVVMHPERPVSFRRPVHLKSALRGKDRANSWIEVKKQHRAVYDKRTVLGSGEATLPLKLSMWAS